MVSSSLIFLCFFSLARELTFKTASRGTTKGSPDLGGVLCKLRC